MNKTVSFITKNFGAYDVHSIASYLSIGGFCGLKKVLTMDGDDVVSYVSSCGIKGRGGAGYDVGRKWMQAKSVIAPNKVVICNADEGEPCTFKDRTLLENDPFNLIEGMIIAGYTVNAQNGYIYLREEYSHLRPLLLNAIKQAEEEHFLGDNILGTELCFHIHLYSGAGAYVCGEGTALVESMEGKSGRPRMKPPFIKECGLYNLPTCVNNVESLSIIPHLFHYGKEKYLCHGTPDSVGTKVICVAGNVKNPGAFEIPFGITLREIIYELAGGIVNDNEIQLLQLGGASGYIASPAVLDTPYTYDDLRKVGLLVGSGAILVVDETTDVLEFLKATQEFFSHESCGQCTPCREGNRQIHIIIDKMLEGVHTQKDIATLKTCGDIMCNASLCGLGETAQHAMLSAMRYFPQVFEEKIGGQ